MEWPNGDDFSFPTQLFSPDHFSDYAAWDFHLDQFKETDLYPLSFVDILPNDPPEGFSSSEFGGGKDEKMGSCNSEVEHESAMAEKKLEEKDSRKLSRETISKYFYMPISEAAKELKMGLTLLKKRCRELGIKRWPHRKLISLQTLINNVKEMRQEGENVREALQNLENEKRLLEEVPDIELERGTKRLRQVYFKANYKRRMMMNRNGTPLFDSTNKAHQNTQVSGDFKE